MRRYALKMKLSRYFWLAELTNSKKAMALKISNHPGELELVALKALCCNVLDPIREGVGRAVVVTSGYRCPELNKAVGGASSSQHVLGEAADIHCPGVPLLDFAKLIAASDIPFDQCILEPSWVHVSYSKRNRREVLHTPTGRAPYFPGLPDRWPL